LVTCVAPTFVVTLAVVELVFAAPLTLGFVDAAAPLPSSGVAVCCGAGADSPDEFTAVTRK
jgi:hypothetical protein